jgi:ATP synthase protein I
MSENTGGPDDTFENRLRAARSRQGLDAPPSAAPDASGARGAAGGSQALGTGLRVGVELVSALAVALAIGWGLDRWLHTMPLFLVIFVLLGGAAGVLNVWRQVGPAPHRDPPG